MLVVPTFNFGETSFHLHMIFKTLNSALVASSAIAVISCQPIQKDPYDTAGLYGYPDAAAGNPNGSLYDVPANFEEGGSGPADPTPIASTYTVVAGDTLSKISKIHGVSIKAIADANGISNPNMLRIGQNLSIPGR